MQIASATAAGFQVYRVIDADGAVSFVPLNPQNADYVRLQAWIAAGGVVS